MTGAMATTASSAIPCASLSCQSGTTREDDGEAFWHCAPLSSGHRLSMKSLTQSLRQECIVLSHHRLASSLPPEFLQGSGHTDPCHPWNLHPLFLQTHTHTHTGTSPSQGRQHGAGSHFSSLISATVSPIQNNS